MGVMEKRTHLYISRKNPLIWVMALCMVCSAVARIAFFGVKGTGESLYVWSQIVLPVAAALLYAAIALLNGKEMFYKTALSVWMMALQSSRESKSLFSLETEMLVRLEQPSKAYSQISVTDSGMEMLVRLEQP